MEDGRFSCGLSTERHAVSDDLKSNLKSAYQELEKAPSTVSWIDRHRFQFSDNRWILDCSNISPSEDSQTGKRIQSRSIESAVTTVQCFASEILLHNSFLFGVSTPRLGRSARESQTRINPTQFGTGRSRQHASSTSAGKSHSKTSRFDQTIGTRLEHG